MPIQLPDDLHLDSQAREVEVPVSAKDPSQGTVSLTLRELPYGRWREIEIRWFAARQTWHKCLPLGEKLTRDEALTTEEIEALASGEALLLEAHREIIRWGVIGHRGFLQSGHEIPFESVSASFSGSTFQVASDRMLRLYLLSGQALLYRISAAVQHYQAGQVRSPSEIWAEART